MSTDPRNTSVGSKDMQLLARVAACLHILAHALVHVDRPDQDDPPVVNEIISIQTLKAAEKLVTNSISQKRLINEVRINFIIVNCKDGVNYKSSTSEVCNV